MNQVPHQFNLVEWIEKWWNNRLMNSKFINNWIGRNWNLQSIPNCIEMTEAAVSSRFPGVPSSGGFPAAPAAVLRGLRRHPAALLRQRVDPSGEQQRARLLRRLPRPLPPAPLRRPPPTGRGQRLPATPTRHTTRLLPGPPHPGRPGSSHQCVIAKLKLLKLWY